MNKLSKEETLTKSKNKGSKIGYGPNNFKLTSKNQKLSAISYENLTKLERCLLINDYEKFYEEIPIPVEDDWLWEHSESEQTFNQYTRQILNQPTKSKNVVCLVNLDSVEEENLVKFSRILEAYYPNLKAKILSSPTFSNAKINERNAFGYQQLHATEINNLLKRNKPKDCIYIIALTSFDLFHDTSDYLFGLANDANGCCVISTRRFTDEIDSIYKESNDEYGKGLTLKIVIQTILHELGHLLGLAHCIYFKCNMNGGNNMKETLSQPFEICPICVRKITKVLKIDLISRIEGLSQVLEKTDPNVFKDEINWYKKRLQYMKVEKEKF